MANTNAHPIFRNNDPLNISFVDGFDCYLLLMWT